MVGNNPGWGAGGGGTEGDVLKATLLTLRQAWVKGSLEGPLGPGHSCETQKGARQTCWGI